MLIHSASHATKCSTYPSVSGNRNWTRIADQYDDPFDRHMYYAPHHWIVIVAQSNDALMISMIKMKKNMVSILR
jgi:hypothetical protein